MKIKRMSATFGVLDKATLTPGEGLTVITAPNERGKSTWAGFLKSMLYGVDTRERDKVGYLADKNRYQPWSGAPMWGELDLEWEGRAITLRRSTNKSGPFQGFEAVYTASGDPVPGLTAANAGQTLLGVGRDVFVRSALVGQNATAVTSAPELESRISALATTGQEEVSFSAVQRDLKDWRNRRRSNRSNGLIPELERELEQVERTLSAMEQARLQRDEARSALDRLEAERAQLLAEEDIHRRLAQKQLNIRCAQAMELWNTAKAQLEQLPPPDPRFDGLSPAQVRELVRQQAAREEELYRAKLEEQAEKKARCAALSRKRTVITVLCALSALACLAAGALLPLPPLVALGAALAVAAVAAAVVLSRSLRTLQTQLNAPEAQPPSPASDLEQAAELYLQWLNRREQLTQEVRHHKERVEDLKAQGGQEYSTLELLHPPLRSPQETAARRRTVEGEITRWQTRLDQAIGALGTDPLTLEAKREALEQQLEERTAQFDALTLALEGLETANSLLRERFSPELNKAASSLFSQLTGTAYSQLSLSRDFSATVSSGSAQLPHSQLYLSAGTADQLYLAVRLAICQLTLPQAPLLLDDALCAFDDTRMALALDCLKQLSAQRQILLFTCHSREARWAEQNGVPVIAL